MQARKHVTGEGAIYGPEALKMMAEAFEKAWEKVAGHFEPRSKQAEAYRLKLANAILAVGPAAGRGVDDLKNAALQAVALDYRR